MHFSWICNLATFMMVSSLTEEVVNPIFTGADNSDNSTNMTTESVDWVPGLYGRRDTCLNQAPVISFTVEAIDDTESRICGECLLYRVCLVVNIPEPEFFRQTCVKNESRCNPPDFSSYIGQKYNTAGVGLAEGEPESGISDQVTVKGGMQCQIGAADSFLEFLLDDGQCWVDPVTASRLNYEDFAQITQSGLTFECHSSKYWNEVRNESFGKCCTCGKEIDGCVWRVYLPPCGTSKMDRSAPPSPSPSPVCYCPPLNAECAQEEAIQEQNGWSHHIDITNCTDPQDIADYINKIGLSEDQLTYGCRVSTIPNCNNIFCERFVPSWIYSSLSTCPVPSPSP